MLKFNSLIDSIKPNNLKYKFEIFDQSHVGAMQAGLDAGLGDIVILLSKRIANKQKLGNVRIIIHFDLSSYKLD